MSELELIRRAERDATACLASREAELCSQVANAVATYLRDGGAIDTRALQNAAARLVDTMRVARRPAGPATLAEVKERIALLNRTWSQRIQLRALYPGEYALYLRPGAHVRGDLRFILTHLMALEIEYLQEQRTDEFQLYFVPSLPPIQESADEGA